MWGWIEIDLHSRALLPPEDRGGGGRVEVDVELLGVVDVVVVVVVVVVESKRFRQIYQSICLVLVVVFVDVFAFECFVSWTKISIYLPCCCCCC